METQREPSRWAVGWATFASAMLALIGVFQLLTGIAAVGNDEFYSEARDWALQLDATTWGWIHMIIGVVLIASAIGIMAGNVLARAVGVIVAMISAVTNFAFIPWYPVWSIVMIAVNVLVIWALTLHGRDVSANDPDPW